MNGPSAVVSGLPDGGLIRPDGGPQTPGGICGRGADAP